ncbi:MAG: hypothetical protein JW864_08265 [Spirochaetes bacterium]|nr:hypothetical protein [Spirochaetota bacterium]
MIQKHFKAIIHINFLTLVILLSFIISSQAEDGTYSDKVGIFGIAGNRTNAALTTETADYIKKIFTYCGRFMPEESKQLDTALEKAKNSNSRNVYIHAGELLSLDILVMVVSYQLGNAVYSDVNIVPLNSAYENFKKTIRIKSENKLNIPLKAGREIAILHRNLPVTALIKKKYENGLYLINAGEWHGLRENTVYPTQKSDIKIEQTGRFESLARIPHLKEIKEKIIIRTYPETDKILEEITNDISGNTISKYSITDITSGNTEKRLLESVCLVNIGTNLIIPGYGAFLSTSYLGFENPKPDPYNITLSTSLIAMHLLLPELMTGFDVNFFPWKQDSDKTEKMQNLQKFLWISLPLTFSASYMDQLAYQFIQSEKLPPFFKNRNNMAGLFSLFIPGGGLFYKGRRAAGWGFYFSEMALAGYGIYNQNKDKGRYALYASGAVKIFDIAYAWFCSSGFSFYDRELERDVNTPVTIGFRPGAENESIITLMVSTGF